MNASIRRPEPSGHAAGSSHRRRRAAARRVRPALDLLEDRRMLSINVTVNSLLDQLDQAGSTTVTLRDAINLTNQYGGGTITFTPKT